MSQSIRPDEIAEIFEIDITKREEQTPAKPAVKKVSEQQQKILQLFDQFDTEHTKELDVYQLKKYIEKEWKVSLTEESIKYHCGQMFLEKAYKVQRSEFMGFHKYFSANITEISVCNSVYRGDLQIEGSGTECVCPVRGAVRRQDRSRFPVQIPR